MSTKLQVTVEAVVTGDKSPQEAMLEYAQVVTPMIGKERIITIDG